MRRVSIATINVAGGAALLWIGGLLLGSGNGLWPIHSVMGMCFVLVGLQSLRRQISETGANE